MTGLDRMAMFQKALFGLIILILLSSTGCRQVGSGGSGDGGNGSEGSPPPTGSDGEGSNPGGGSGGPGPNPPPNPPPSGNNPPEISGTSDTIVTEGNWYVFAPFTFDQDGDGLTFAVTNLPAWADFDQNDGSIIGMPDAGDVGTYNNIMIQVSDGTYSASLPPFDLEVMASQVLLGSTTLSWSTPTEYTDDTPLNGLSGFNIYYGTVAGYYPHRLTLDDAGINEAEVNGLMVGGQYFFVMTAFDSLGTESSYSNMITRVIN